MPDIALASQGNEGDFFIHFSVPVSSFGSSMSHNNRLLGIVTYQAFSGDDLIEVVSFEGDAIHRSYSVLDYGFMGIVSDQLITSVHVTGHIAPIQDFRFSSVPEPSTSLLLLSGILFGIKHRQKA